MSFDSNGYLLTPTTDQLWFLDTRMSHPGGVTDAFAQQIDRAPGLAERQDRRVPPASHQRLKGRGGALPQVQRLTRARGRRATRPG